MHSSKLFSYLGISALRNLSAAILLLLPFFLAEGGWSSQKIGWAIGLFFFSFLVVQVFAGHLADLIGNVPTALLGAGITLLAGLCYLGALWFPNLVFLARLLHGGGSALILTGALVNLVRSVPQELRGRMMGYFGLPGFVVMGVGPLLAEGLVKYTGFGGAFTTIMVVSLMIAWILRKLPRPLSTTKREPLLRVLQINLPRLRPVLILAAFFGFCVSIWSSFLAPALAGIGPGAVSAFGFGYGSGALLTRLGLSQWLDTHDRRLLAISTLVAYSVGLALIPQSSSLWHLGFVGLICGMCHGVYYPALSALASERFHPLHTGQGMSLYTAASSLGFFIGPPVWGSLTDLTSYKLTFASSGLLLVVAVVTFVAFESRRVTSTFKPSGTRSPEAPGVN